MSIERLRGGCQAFQILVFMKIEQIALQFFTLRDLCKTQPDFVKTCKAVAEIGYQSVQISGVDRTVIPEREIAKICADHGLKICATHESSDEIINKPEEVIRRLQDIGCNYTAYPFPMGFDLGSEAAISELIEKLNRAGQVLSEAGMTLTYHNHHHEFRQLNGRILLERIYEETNPVYLQGEIDTYWIQYGGGNNIDWCERLKGRLPLIHLKDYYITEESKINFSEVGSGNLPFPRIIKAAAEAGCEWFIVEQDICPGDPLESVQKSFDYLKTLAVC
jgi:sugar phosphate isomerase/epimerase